MTTSLLSESDSWEEEGEGEENVYKMLNNNGASSKKNGTLMKKVSTTVKLGYNRIDGTSRFSLL